MTYTQLAVTGVALAVVLDLAVLRTKLLSRKVFWASYAIIVFFQLVTNGWLTGRGIVRYSDRAILGSAHIVFLGDGRVAFAPVEDLAFGFALVLMTCAAWVRLGPDRRAGRRHRTRL